jgi:hypothetical protein
MGVGMAKPFLRYFRDLTTPLFSGILVIKDTPLYMQVRIILDIDHPVVTQLRDQGFLDHSNLPPFRILNLY